MRPYRLVLLAVILAPAAGCRSTPDYGPDEASNLIADHLAANETSQAEEIYASIQKSDHHREAVFATVYERAGQHYRKDGFDPALRMLRFLHERYPAAAAPRLALLYTLYRQRAGAPGASNAQIAEVQTLVKEIRRDGENYPAWVDLAAAQAALDEGRLDSARQEHARFKARWDGRPAEMRFHVQEFERYFAMREAEGA